VRFTDPKHLRVGKLGPVRVMENTRQVRRMLEAGRFHVHSVTVTRKGGRWVATVAGVAAQLHHQHRRRYHPSRPKSHRQVGADFGIKSLVIAADFDGNEVRVWEGVNALRTALWALVRATSTALRAMPAATGSPIENQARIDRPRQGHSPAPEDPRADRTDPMPSRTRHHHLACVEL
jgi:hypothetical protein